MSVTKIACPECHLTEHVATVEMVPAFWPINGWDWDTNGPAFRNISEVVETHEGFVTDDNDDGIHMKCLNCQHDWWLNPSFLGLTPDV